MSALGRRFSPNSFDNDRQWNGFAGWNLNPILVSNAICHCIDLLHISAFCLWSLALLLQYSFDVLQLQLHYDKIRGRHLVCISHSDYAYCHLILWWRFLCFCIQTNKLGVCHASPAFHHSPHSKSHILASLCYCHLLLLLSIAYLHISLYPFTLSFSHSPTLSVSHALYARSVSKDLENDEHRWWWWWWWLVVVVVVVWFPVRNYRVEREWKIREESRKKEIEREKQIRISAV